MIFIGFKKNLGKTGELLEESLGQFLKKCQGTYFDAISAGES